MVKSNQRITKIKRDPIEELLKKAEATPVENACIIQPQGMDLTPYPDMNSLRLWVHDYLLNGINAAYINNIDASGQTYLTTIVDGLPLVTKLTKSVYIRTGFINFNQPTLDSNGVIGGASFAVTADSEVVTYALNTDKLTTHGSLAYMATNPDTGYWQSNSDTTNHYLTYYNPEAIKLSSIEFNNYLCTDSSYIPTNFTIQGSNTGDASDWINIQTIENSNTTVGTNSPYSFDVSTQYSYKYFRIYINSPQSTVQIGYMKLVGTVESSQIPVEITKPGLWLSNLCKPYQVSYAGGWLRQNLINHSNKEFDTINSDTIGNYSFSFFQRGIIHRDVGSTHADNDSYCQHWSPSALGCISHDSIIIPTNNLRNTYTSYQTLAVPSDVNMQYYSETPSKDVEFTFVDNNDNIPLTTTSFNGRVVGDGWKYEFVFEPNYGGSGNNYGETEEDVPNGSNGGCVTGQITYQLDNGDTCVQTIDKCFITDQALFNPYNHSTGDALNDKGEYILHKDWVYTCGKSVELYDGPGVVLGATTSISNCCGSASMFLSYSDVDRYDGSECTTSWGSGSSTVKGDKAVAETALSSTVGVWNADCCNSYGGSATLYFKEALEPQTNVTIYLNIWDLKKEYAAQGLPWAYTCEYDRFRVDISTQPCSDWYCKSFVIAENVDINDLGDISALQRIVFSGG